MGGKRRARRANRSDVTAASGPLSLLGLVSYMIHVARPTTKKRCRREFYRHDSHGTISTASLAVMAALWASTKHCSV